MHGLGIAQTKPVAVNDRADRLPVSDCHSQGVAGQLGCHPVTDRVANDLVRPDVNNQTNVKFAFTRRVFGDIGEPGLIRSLTGEVPVDQIVMNWRARLT